MTNLSSLCAILQMQLSDAFAELACHSSSMANSLLQQFPGYVDAKYDLGHVFWHSDAGLMIQALRDLPAAIYEQIESMD